MYFSFETRLKYVKLMYWVVFFFKVYNGFFRLCVVFVLSIRDRGSYVVVNCFWLDELDFNYRSCVFII